MVQQYSGHNMKLDNSLKSHIQQLQDAARQNRLVIFVGAGVSASAGVPAWRELVDMFNDKINENSRSLLTARNTYSDIILEDNIVIWKKK